MSKSICSMQIPFLIRSAIDDFKRNKGRVFLTSLGILIGVASVVLLMAFGLGLKRYIERQFQSLGSNLIFILPGGALSGGVVGGIQFDERDASTVRKIQNVEISAPVYAKMTKIKGLNKTETYEFISSTADIFTLLNLEIDRGRAYTKSDFEKGNKVVVLGPSAAQKIFGSVDGALNKILKIEDQGFKVIGVAKVKGGGGVGTPSIDDRMYMPYTATLSFNPNKKFFGIYLKANSSENLSQVKIDAKRVLAKRYKPEDFDVTEQTEFLNTINSIFTILNSVLVAIAAISLVVGGIGIMNIMYASVTERTREIGIRRAIGATQRNILWQFTTEAVLLSVLGGLLGLGISYLVVIAIQRLFPAYINFTTVLLALGVSSLIGIVFGVFPANKAAKLSPIEAIRYE